MGELWERRMRKEEEEDDIGSRGLSNGEKKNEKYKTPAK